MSSLNTYSKTQSHHNINNINDKCKGNHLTLISASQPALADEPICQVDSIHILYLKMNWTAERQNTTKFSIAAKCKHIFFSAGQISIQSQNTEERQNELWLLPLSFLCCILPFISIISIEILHRINASFLFTKKISD